MHIVHNLCRFEKSQLLSHSFQTNDESSLEYYRWIQTYYNNSLQDLFIMWILPSEDSRFCFYRKLRFAILLLPVFASCSYHCTGLRIWFPEAIIFCFMTINVVYCYSFFRFLQEVLIEKYRVPSDLSNNVTQSM